MQSLAFYTRISRMSVRQAYANQNTMGQAPMLASSWQTASTPCSLAKSSRAAGSASTAVSSLQDGPT